MSENLPTRYGILTGTPIHDSRWQGKQLIAFEDDASRFITGYGVYDEATSENASAVLLM